MEIQPTNIFTVTTHFVLQDADLPFAWDAYLMELNDDPDRPDAQYVVLFPTDPDLPNHLYVPRGTGGAEGVPHEQVLRNAVHEYQLIYQQRIDTLPDPLTGSTLERGVAPSAQWAEPHDHERTVLVPEDFLPVDEHGFDDFYYWLGRVRAMALTAQFGGSNRWLSQIDEYVTAGAKVVAEIEPASGAGYGVAVWAYGPERADLVWGAPLFRAPQDAEVIRGELRRLIEALKLRIPVGATAPLRSP